MTMPQESIARESRHLVVVGASAGGVEAISALLASLPPDLAAPVVVAQHLNPGRPSHLHDILGRRSTLPLRAVGAREPLEDGVVFVIPANHDAEIEGTSIVLHEATPRRAAPSIDRLMRSAAASVGAGTIAVVLSGSGSDGAVGAHEVAAAGGTVLIQDPVNAGFPSMPLAVAAGSVDIVAQPAAMGPLLERLISGPLTEADPANDRQLRLLLARLGERSGIDFAAYKRPTILRRLQGRMAATHQATLADYVGFLEKEPDEYERLTGSLLIKVTEFFRDPKVMDHLRRRVLPDLVAQAQATRELRVWCAGCATGEEAYTIAMLVADALGDQRERIDVRIFATDVDAAALAFARRGVYDARTVRNVPPGLLTRHFVAAGDEYSVTREVRELVVFGEHDLGARPPFPRIDLVLCRNVLIYFLPELQQRVLRVFAFALREGGWLVLGSSESAASLGHSFTPVPGPLKIYRRDGPAPAPPLMTLTRAPAQVPRPARAVPGAVSGHAGSRKVGRSGEAHAERILLEMPVGVVTVGRRWETLRINPAARRLLGIHGSALGDDFTHLAETLPASTLRTALRGALQGESSTTWCETPTPDLLTGRPRYLDVSCAPFRERPGDPIVGAVILISDASPVAEDRAAVPILRQRLQQAIDETQRLLTVNEEVTSANDQLRVANEELLIGAEDAQASTEEAETLTEELQASNEELETLNEELQASVEELNVANEDLAARTDELAAQAAVLTVQTQELAQERDRMKSILHGMTDAVLAVDADGRAVMWNETYEAIFGDPAVPFVPEDEASQPLAAEAWPQQRARRGESFSVSFTMRGPDGARRWFEAKGSSLRLPIPGWAGIVVIREVTERSLRALQEQFLIAASHELRTPIAALHGYVQLLARRLDPAADEAAAGYAASALAQTRRLGELTDRLFDLSLFAMKRMTLERRRVDLVALARRVAEVTAVLAGGTQISVHEAPARLTVDGDPGRLEQVVTNLITNALVHGAARNVDMKLQRVGPWAEIVVADDGGGIPADEMPGLFDRFARAGEPRRGVRVGLGLGLFLAREIVVAHGGSIEAASEVGHGTTITVRLPMPAPRSHG
ncbi:MAG: PAS domain-containing protein [Chloroflexi bacterium]|nr:PAS domain-containing protein [Chloroflexota bacterium]